jgi:YD repeat-containing protein
VGVGFGEAGEFAPAHAGVGGGDDEDLVAATYLVSLAEAATPTRGGSKQPGPVMEAGAVSTVGTANAATTYWQYDPATSQPLTVTWPDNTTDQFTYDADGNTLSHTDALNRTTGYTYNAAGDQLSVTPPGQNTIAATYDTAGNKLTSVTPSGKTITSTYNTDGTLASLALPGHPATTYSYETNGDLKSIADPEDRVVHYGYDTDGRAITITDPSQPEPTRKTKAWWPRISRY